MRRDDVVNVTFTRDGDQYPEGPTVIDKRNTLLAKLERALHSGTYLFALNHPRPKRAGFD